MADRLETSKRAAKRADGFARGPGDAGAERPRRATKVRACSVRDLPAGQRIIIDLPDHPAGSVGVFATAAGYFALRNHCPHHGAPLCEGEVSGITISDGERRLEYELDGRVISCPWHHWEFDLKTGRAVFDPKTRARTYAVEVEDGDIFVDLAGRVREDEEILRRAVGGSGPGEETDG